MDTAQVHEVALRLGILPQALDQVAAKVQAHFGGVSNPRPADVEAYVASLSVWDKLGMEKAAFDAMPVTWRKTQGEAHQGQPVHDREARRWHPQPPQDLVEAWSKLPPMARLTAKREWEAQQTRPAPSQG
jgi:hypothetical protein